MVTAVALVALLLSLSSLVVASPTHQPGSAFRRRDGTRTFCTPNTLPSCWPTTAEWSAFNSTISGNLIQVTPWANPCYTNPGPYDAVACEAIKAEYQDGVTRAGQVGATQMDNWSECTTNAGLQTCAIGAATTQGQLNPFPVTTRSCQLGRLSPYAVAAHSAADVEAAVKFANARNIRMVIKNTGHEYLGRATAPDTLMIWTHNLQGLQYSSNFQGNQAIIMGAGTNAQDAYRFAAANNVDITLGAYSSVGVAGGFAMGGGHGPFGPQYGLAVDNILQYTVVTPAGELVNADANTNQDLYYALRGGGGAVWGVVTQLVYKVRPAKPVVAVVANITLNPLLTSAQRQTAISNYVQQQALYEVGWRQKGWSGYTFITSTNILFSHFLPGGTLAQANSDMQAFLAYLETQPLQWTAVPIINYFTNFDACRETVFKIGEPQTAVAYSERLSSRLISVSQYSTPAGRLALGNAVAEAFFYANSNSGLSASDASYRAGSSIQLYSTGPLPAQFGGPSGADTGVNPAWRDSIWEVLLFTNWVPGISTAGRDTVAQKASKAMDYVRPYGQGTYYSESDVLEPNWQQAFFGANYNKLVQIKQKWDPNNVFTVWKGIGYEGQENQAAFACYDHA